jgi:hypothetical protein
LPFAVVLTALAAGAGGAHAQQRQDASHEATAIATTLAVADLEKAFWICDYVATTGAVATLDAVLCHAVYDRLKAERFGGDFERLLAWWRANKVAEHRKLDALASDVP